MNAWAVIIFNILIGFMFGHFSIMYFADGRFIEGIMNGLLIILIFFLVTWYVNKKRQMTEVNILLKNE